jgi:HEAT repeat protein
MKVFPSALAIGGVTALLTIAAVVSRERVPGTRQVIALVHAVDRLDRIRPFKSAADVKRENHAVVELRKIGLRAIPCILANVKRNRSPVRAWVHGKYRKLPVQIRKLVAIPEPLDLHSAGIALSLFGPEGIDQWKCAFIDEDPTMRALALETVSFLGRQASSLMPSVLELLRDPDPKVRSMAVFALATMRPTSSAIVPGLIGVVDPAAPFSTWSAYERLLAVGMLGSLGRGAGEAAPALRRLLNQTNAFEGAGLSPEICRMTVERDLQRITRAEINEALE